MKKLFTALLLLVGFVSFSQSIGYFRYDSIRMEKVGGNSELILLNSTRDSVGVLFNIGNGRTRFKTLSSLGVGSKVSNGIRMAGDTIQLGGTIHRATHLLLENHQTSGSVFSYLHLANRPEAETIIQEDTLHPTVSIYNPTTLAAEALYEESAGDTAYLHYGGRFESVVRNVFDSTSTRFAATNKSIVLPSNGFEGVYQFMIPRDSTVWGVGPDGQSSGVIHAQWDLGDTYGYNTNVVPASTVPGFPLVTVLSSIDLMRNIDNTRRHKMTGAGVAGFMSKYKSYQTSINMSTYEAGNRTDSVFGYKAYGDHNPLISGATKAKTLAVWDVKHAFAFYSEPQYRYTNTVRDGYGFVAKGDSDYSHLPWLNIGPYSTLPERANGGNNSFADRLYITGNMRATGNTYAFVTQAYGFATTIPIAVGTEAGITFQQTDSAQTAVLGAYLAPGSRNLRGGYWRSEMYNGATMDNNQTGGFLQWETGVNHTNITRQWRNGNFFIGYTTAMDSFRLYKKLAVQGASVFTDTVTVKNIPIAPAGDTTNYFNVGINSKGDLYRVSYGGGSGGGSGLTVGTTTIASGTTTRVLYDNAGVLGEYTLTGSGTAVAMGTSPTFTTDITTPIINGSTSAGGTLTLKSTTNGTKGKVLFGTSAYDEVNNRLGIGTAAPAAALDNNGGTAILGQIQTVGSAVTGNFYAAATTNMTSTSTANYLLPGGTGTSFRVAINGTTNSTLGSGQDAADLVVTGSASAEFSTGTHPRSGTAFFGSKVMTNAGGATDTLYGIYVNGPATGVTPTSGSWNTIFNAGDVFLKQGKLRIGGVGLGTGQIDLAGTTSGIISMKLQAAAGTYNWNLPTTAGTAGYLLTSQAGGSTAMTWTDPATFISNPMTTTGDMIYASSGSTPARLAIGTNGDYLKVVAGVPTWSSLTSTISSGSFTPSLTSTTNIASSTGARGIYTRSINVIDFSITVQITPTAGSTTTSFNVDIPIASNFTTGLEVVGTCSADGSNNQHLTLDTANDKITGTFTSSGTSAVWVTLEGKYTIQ